MNFANDLSSLSGLPHKKWLPSKRSLVVVGVVVLIILIGAAVWLYGRSRSGASLPIGASILGQSKVEAKKEYKNPFDRTSQFVNPFSEVKSPFTALH